MVITTPSEQRKETGQHFQYQTHIFILCYNFPPVNNFPLESTLK